MATSPPEGHLVLIVDDFDDALEIYQQYLTFKGYRVMTAGTGAEAVELARARHPSLIFMDLRMAVLLLDSEGKTRILGLTAISIVGCVEAYAFGLSRLGTSLNAEAPGLRLAFLLPLGWLLLESRKTSDLHQRKTAAAVG